MENKGLEALEEIKTCKLIDKVKVKEGLFSIKLLSLKRRYGKDVFSKQIPIIEKELKALEIITRLFTFRLNVSLGDKSHQNNIRVCTSNDNKCEYAKWDSLTDEEYDLLKEVLL